MEILRKPPTVKAPADRFTGDVGSTLSRVAWSRRVSGSASSTSLRVHATHGMHTRTARPYVTEGIGSSRPAAARSSRSGPAPVHTPPGEWHWHGATPDHFMTDIALSRSAEVLRRTGATRSAMRVLATARVVGVTRWTTDEQTQIGDAEVLQIASQRPDGALAGSSLIWVVRSGHDLYVRSAYGYANTWFQRCLTPARAGHRVAGLDAT